MIAENEKIKLNLKKLVKEDPFFIRQLIVEINEEDYSIYYGASEVLEGDRYKTIGIYRYK